MRELFTANHQQYKNSQKQTVNFIYSTQKRYKKKANSICSIFICTCLDKLVIASKVINKIKPLYSTKNVTNTVVSVFSICFMVMVSNNICTEVNLYEKAEQDRKTNGFSLLILKEPIVPTFGTE